MKIILSNNPARKILLILSVLSMAMIFILSSFPASDSSQQSGAISGLLAGLFGGEISAAGQSILEAVVRKTAHVLEFTALGGLWYGYFLCSELKTRKSVTLSFVISVLYAVSDEVHQYFVPGRAARIYDVGFDALGVVIGILLAEVIYRRIKRRNKNAS